MKTATILAAVALGACGSSSPAKTPDAASNVPATVTISGTASERSVSGTTVVPGAMVVAYNNSDPGTAVAMTTTDASGNYSLPIPTMGKAVDGFVKATKSGYKDTYLYAPYALTADFSGASINMLTPNTFDLIQGTLCAANQDAAKGTIAVLIVDSTNTAVMGATAASAPAGTKTCYTQGGFPNKSATATDTDGLAIMFNVTGSATVSASKSGATFKSHAVNAVAGAFTTTIVSE